MFKACVVSDFSIIIAGIIIAIMIIKQIMSAESHSFFIFFRIILYTGWKTNAKTSAPMIDAMNGLIMKKDRTVNIINIPNVEYLL